MDKKDYSDKVNTLLQEGPYVEIIKDQTSSIVNSIKKGIKNSVILNNDTKIMASLVLPSVLVFMIYLRFTKSHEKNNTVVKVTPPSKNIVLSFCQPEKVVIISLPN